MLRKNRWLIVLTVAWSGCRMAPPEDQNKTQVRVLSSSPAQDIRVQVVKQNDESRTLLAYIRAVEAELDARMSGSETEAVRLLQRSIQQLEEVVRLGYGTLPLRLKTASGLRFLASRQSDSAVRKKLMERAAKHYFEALREHGDSHEAMEGYLTIERAVLRTPLKQTIKVFEGLAQEKPDARGIRFRLGDLYLGADRPDEAANLFGELAGQYPKNPRVWYQKGRAEYTQGKFQEALASFEKSTRLQGVTSDMYEALRAQASCLVALGERPRAQAILARLVAEQESVAENWIELAKWHFQGKDYDSTLKVLARALSLKPRNFLANVLMGRSFMALGRTDEALSTYKRLTVMWPDQAQSWAILGEAQLNTGRFGDAADSLVRARKLRSEMQNGFLLAEALRLGGKLKQAEKLLTELLEQAPDDFDVLRTLFFLKLDLEEFGSSYEIARGLHDKKPSFLTNYMLGASLERLGRLDESIVYLKRAIDEKPDFASARNYLGYLYAEHGIHLEESIQQIELALEIDPDNGAYLDSLGWAYYRLGRLQEARRQLVRAVEALDREGAPDSVVYGHLGDIYFGLSCYGKAFDAWKSALKLEEDPKLRRSLKKKLGRLELKQPSPRDCQPSKEEAVSPTALR